MLIDDTKKSDFIYKLETNIDDCTGENLGFVMEKLIDSGARDVYFSPVYMKKSRPAYILSVICSECDIHKLEQIIFCETTTIGIRRMKMERTILTREIKTVQTPIGEAMVKVCQIGSETRLYPEYKSVSALCKSADLTYSEAYNLIVAAAKSIYFN